MDLDQWVVVPDNESTEDGENKIFSVIRNSDSNFVLNVEYFPNPSANSLEFQNPGISKILYKILPISTNQSDPDDDPVKEIEGPDQITGCHSQQDYFNKLKEKEFVDKTIPESPKSGSSKGIAIPQLIDEIMVSSPRMNMIDEKRSMEFNEKEYGGINILKWGLNGIGAICSFGIATATVCILIFGSNQRDKHHHQHKLRFQIFADDKGMNQVVEQATKMNEAISAAIGVHMTRAHITSGGYYDAL